MYNWYTVNTGKLCPAGWHLPSNTERATLTDYLGGINIAGGKLKEAGTAHWISPNTGATNESGFTGLPGGLREYYDGTFNFIVNDGFWWSSTEYSSILALNLYLLYDNSSASSSTYNKRDGFSIRCIRN